MQLQLLQSLSGIVWCLRFGHFSGLFTVGPGIPLSHDLQRIAEEFTATRMSLDLATRSFRHRTKTHEDDAIRWKLVLASYIATDGLQDDVPIFMPRSFDLADNDQTF